MARGSGVMRLVRLADGTVLAERLEVPRSFFGRGVGLMFRRTLPAAHGMWIKPCNGIHMFFMRFPIDAVFLDREQRVVKLYPRLGRWRVVPYVRGAHSVVELTAGTAEPVALVPGERLAIEPAP